MKKKIKDKLTVIFILIFFIGGALGVYFLASKAIEGTKMTTKKVSTEKKTGNFTGVTTRGSNTTTTTKAVTTTSSNEKINALENIKKKEEEVTTQIAQKKITVSEIEYLIPNGWAYRVDDDTLIVTDSNINFAASIIYIENMEISKLDETFKTDLDKEMEGYTFLEEGVTTADDITYNYYEYKNEENAIVFALVDSNLNGMFLVTYTPTNGDLSTHANLKEVIKNVLLNAY